MDKKTCGNCHYFWDIGNAVKGQCLSDPPKAAIVPQQTLQGQGIGVISYDPEVNKSRIGCRFWIEASSPLQSDLKLA